VREFCEFWRIKTLPAAAADAAAAGETATDENSPVVKVSKRKAEAKIREIAVYEFRPQCYKYKLWYVNDKTLEELNLSLPVPTKWKWITLAPAVPALSTEANTPSVAKQSTNVNSVQPSPTTSSGTIKSFMTPNGSHQQNPVGNSANTTKGSDGQSPTRDIQQSTTVSSTEIELVSSASPVCTSVVCDNTAAAGSKLGSQNPVRPSSTPRSSSSVNKRKVQSVGRRGQPVKQQPRLFFKKKPEQPANDDDCMVVDSCTNNIDNAMSNADKSSAQPSDLGTVGDVKAVAQQLDVGDDCMIIDYVQASESGTKSNADEHCTQLRGDVLGSASDVHTTTDEKSLPETDANCNVCVESSVNDANKPVEIAADADD